MEKMIYTNPLGQSIELSGTAPFMLTSILGTGATDVDFKSQKAPYQDGVTYVDVTLKERPINIQIEILATTPEELFELRKEVGKVFNPKLGPGTLRYEYYGKANEIIAFPDVSPVFPDGNGNKGLTFQKAMISIICPNPFWMDTYESEEPLTAWIGKFEFPFEFPVEFGERANRVTINNSGDVSTPVLIEFHGPATNPIVSNETTGEYIKVNRTLGENDVLEVSTAFGDKTVEIVSPDGTRINVFNYIDLDSSFFNLITGDNDISFSSDDVDQTGTVKIIYKKRYLAI